MTACAAADPLLSHETLGDTARLYLSDVDPADSRVFALHGDVAGMPHVFTANTSLSAAAALDGIAAFLRRELGAGPALRQAGRMAATSDAYVA